MFRTSNALCYIFTTTLFCVFLPACGHYTDDKVGRIEDFNVTGTNGQTTDPADLTPTENAGQFSVNYDIAPGDNTDLTLSIRSAQGEQITLLDTCCNDSGCGSAKLSCIFDAANGITCGGTRTDLTGYFQRNGGIPNTSRFVLDTATYVCSAGINSFAPIKHSASWGAVFH